MSLLVGVNSWVTTAEADAYLGDKWGVGAEWTGLTTTEKEQALVTSYRWIQGLRQYNISPSSTNENVKNAQIELAYYIVENYTQHKKRTALYAQGVRDFSISKWKEKLEKAGLPSEVEGLLKDFLTNIGGRFPVAERDFN
jgi:hypothetical protein